LPGGRGAAGKKRVAFLVGECVCAPHIKSSANAQRDSQEMLKEIRFLLRHRRKGYDSAGKNKTRKSFERLLQILHKCSPLMELHKHTVHSKQNSKIAKQQQQYSSSAGNAKKQKQRQRQAR